MFIHNSFLIIHGSNKKTLGNLEEISVSINNENISYHNLEDAAQAVLRAILLVRNANFKENKVKIRNLGFISGSLKKRKFKSM